MNRLQFILLIFAIFFIGICVSLFDNKEIKASDMPVREKIININSDNKCFKQIMEIISGQAEVLINVKGHIPSGKRDFYLNDISLEQAIDQVMRFYGVQNHAVAYNSGDNSLVLALFGISNPASLSSQTAHLSSDKEPNYDDQSQPKKHLEQPGEEKETMLTKLEKDTSLTPDQLQRLQKQNSQFLTELNRNDSLAPNQLQQLKKQSMQFEAEANYPEQVRKN